MRVYLAAPYAMKNIITGRVEELQRYGIVVTASWHREPHAPNTQMQELTPEQHRGYAVQDLRDMADADILVFHTDPTKTIVRGGRHVEFGFALGLGLTRAMPIFVVGLEFENIFHHLPQVTHYKSWDQTKDALIDLFERTVF
jgi:nucleoside 2-deoxyribosyltransferase